MYDINKKQDNLSTAVTERDLVDGIRDKYGVIYSKDGRRLLKCVKKHIIQYAIKEGTEVICSEAFRVCYIGSIEIPDSVTTIGGCAFWGCRGFTSVNIPDSVTTIEGCAFSGCEGLRGELKSPTA